MAKPYAAWDFIRLPFRLARMVLPGLPLPADEAAAARNAIHRTQAAERYLVVPTADDRDCIMQAIDA